MIKQTRIFAPFNSSYSNDHWYENILGRIIKPVTEKYSQLDWFWFSRYEHPLGISEDCNVNEIKGIYLGGNHSTRSIRFRYAIEDTGITAFEDELRNAIANNGCYITDYRIWDKIADVGSGHHIGGQITAERQKRRAERVVRLYHEISLLTLDALEDNVNSKDFEFEKTPFTQMRLTESCFTQPHHLFCNITKVPLWTKVKVWVAPNRDISIRTETEWMAPNGYLGNQSGNSNPDLETEMPTNFA